MKKITVAGILLVMLSVFIFNGEACAFFFKKGMSSKEIEEKATEILKGSIPGVDESQLKIHAVEVCYGKDKVLESVCYMVPVNLMHDRFRAYFYYRLQGLYNNIPELDLTRFLVKVPDEGPLGYLLLRDECTWLDKLYFEFSRKTFEETDWTEISSLVSLYSICDYCSLAGIKLCQR